MRNTLFLFALTFFILSLCACSQEEAREESVYFSFADMFAYLTKAFGTDGIDIRNDDNCDERYLSKGWSLSQDQAKDDIYRWAIGSESCVLLYYTKLSKKIVSMSCKPFNPSGQPYQAADVFINDIFLRTIEFVRDATYRFSIPADNLQYGSNRLSFRWRYQRAPADFGISKDLRNLAVCFLSLRVRDKSKSFWAKRNGKEIVGSVDFSGSTISVSPGGIVEYYLTLPQAPILKFGLSGKGANHKKYKARIAIYNANGNEIVREISADPPIPQGGYHVNLKNFAGETVKIVFSNDSDNAADFILSWVNPVIAAPSGVRPVSFAENGEATRTTRHSQPETISPKRPHVFIYLIDTLRADHLSCYGYYRKTTPCIDEFAKDSVLFKNGFANASWTKPAVGSVLTGRYPNKHGAEDRKDKLAGEVMMLPEILYDHGYHTAYITSNGNVTRDYNFDQGSIFYTDDFSSFFRAKYGELRTAEETGRVLYHSSEFVNAAFATFVEGQLSRSKGPAFAFLHTVDPHDPYTPEEPFLKFKREGEMKDDLVFGNKIRLKNYEEGMSPHDVAFIVSLYDCEIAHNDYYFGEFVKYLKRQGLYDDSFIVLIADHGEQFNEHGEFLHGYSIYNEEIHVPLIIKFPQREFAGAQPEFYVSQVDVVPTILDYLGITIPPEVEGTSILQLLQNAELKRTIFMKEYVDGYNYVGFMFGCNKKKHIIRYVDTSNTDILSYEEFDLSKDFHEMNNLFAGGGYFDLKSIQFKADWFLAAMEEGAAKKEAEVDYRKLSPNTLEALRALGYVK